jgi:cyclophilin family peptidyl-prolyl cis-trans isomerase
MKNIRIIIFVILVLSFITLAIHGEKEVTQVPHTNDTNMTDENTNPTVTFKTNLGDVTFELFTDTMPTTAGNFVKLATEGFYTDTKFHRVINGFMIQGGDPLTKDDASQAAWGTGGPGYAIPDEFVEGLSNVVGTLSMANSGPNTGGSQFFINHADNVFLDFDKEPLSSKHPVFGKVIDGMDVVNNIATVTVGPQDVPQTPIVISEVIVSGE